MASVRWAVAIVLLPAALAAFEPALDPRGVLEAVTLGQSSAGNDLRRFHQAYRFDVARPPLDGLDIVTPFRRVVIAAELRARGGDRRFGQREAMGVLAQAPQQIAVHLDLTFHPQNTLVLVPRYEVYWERVDRTRLLPQTVDARPRYYPRTSDALPVPVNQAGRDTPPALPGRGLPMLGAVLVAQFDGVAVRDAMREKNGIEALIVAEAGGLVLARLRIDLGALR
jgi:hypothetical protein